MPETRQQKRAQVAIEKVKVQERKDTGDYSQIAKKFPALVQTCGLAQALAFVAAKEGQTGSDYIHDLSAVMNQQNVQDLPALSREASMVDYQHLTREAIASATWLKRYSEALLRDETGGQNP